ncbi:hypothetical protein BC332_13615 [Capsicum chinense]|nr:hypothetical protein BC332_13615 [Capsicum chinense]
MPFFLTLRSVQNLSGPKVVDGIKIELFGATTITKKIILKGGLVAIDDGSRSGSGSGVAVGANDAPLNIFETTSHYDYDHIGCTNFSSDFGTCSKCSPCKCQDCKAKHDGVINDINARTTSVKEMESNRGIILSKRISYPYTPLEIKVAKRRRKDTSKASSSIEKRKIATPLSLSYADVQCTRDTREKHEPKKENVHHLFQQMIHLVKIIKQIYTSVLINDYSEWIAYGLLKHHAGRNYGPFVVAYAEYLSDGLQVPKNGLDAGLLHKIYDALLWKYREAKAQKPYASNVKDPRRAKLNFVTPDEEQLIHID